MLNFRKKSVDSFFCLINIRHTLDAELGLVTRIVLREPYLQISVVVLSACKLYVPILVVEFLYYPSGQLVCPLLQSRIANVQ